MTDQWAGLDLGVEPYDDEEAGPCLSFNTTAFGYRWRGEALLYWHGQWMVAEIPEPVARGCPFDPDPDLPLEVVKQEFQGEINQLLREQHDWVCWCLGTSYDPEPGGER